MKNRLASLVFLPLLSGLLTGSGCGETSSQPAGRAEHPTRQDACDSPDAPIGCCFARVPAALTATLILGQPGEPGEPLLISGTLLRADGRTPYPGVLLYAYQTDHTGHYTKKGDETGVQKWHGHLHGWARSDAQGRYAIRSTRPAPYPSRTMPAHIHAAIKEPGNQAPYYISDFVFQDDPLVSAQYLATVPAIGGTGVVALRRTVDGGWAGRRDIVLKQ
ncbi:intradiol ring-cleavage dioxygenase [Hymenobacter sp. B81]|uniref:dioxygenase family protein n=1 Tax=Hymenobacter sp. B81 TaxID=3344878 RepID=UPI0037DDB6B4